MFDKERIAKATGHCFQEPGPEAVALLESLLTAEPETLMRQCLLILQTANALLDEEGRQLADIFSAQGKPMVCRPGCTGCCHQLVLCQVFEAQNIYRYLEEHPEKIQAFRTAYPIWDAATARLRHSYLAWAVNYYGRNEDSGSHVVEEYHFPCPFLDGEGHCVIYPVRPYGCRTCIALDPACALPAQRKKEGLHMQFSLYTTHHAARMAVTQMLLLRLGAEAMPVPMPTMLMELLG